MVRRLWLDFGINPSVKLPAETKLGNWISAGTITISFGGDNTRLGGGSFSQDQVFNNGSCVTYHATATLPANSSKNVPRTSASFFSWRNRCFCGGCLSVRQER